MLDSFNFNYLPILSFSINPTRVFDHFWVWNQNTYLKPFNSRNILLCNSQRSSFFQFVGFIIIGILRKCQSTSCKLLGEIYRYSSIDYVMFYYPFAFDRDRESVGKVGCLYDSYWPPKASSTSLRPLVLFISVVGKYFWCNGQECNV